MLFTCAQRKRISLNMCFMRHMRDNTVVVLYKERKIHIIMDEGTFGQDFLLLQCSQDEGGNEEDKKNKVCLKKQKVAVVLEKRENCAEDGNEVEPTAQPKSQFLNKELTPDTRVSPAVKAEQGPKEFRSPANEETKITPLPAKATALPLGAPPTRCCFLCRSPDHQTKNCPTIERVQCKRCGTKGHLEFKCPSRKKKKMVIPLFRQAGGSGETTELQEGDPNLKGDQSLLVTIANGGKKRIDEDISKDNERSVQKECGSTSDAKLQDPEEPSKRTADQDDYQAEGHEVQELKKRLQDLHKKLISLKGASAQNTTSSKDSGLPKKRKSSPEHREFSLSSISTHTCHGSKRKSDSPSQEASTSPKRAKIPSRQLSKESLASEPKTSTLSTIAGKTSPKTSGALGKKEASSSEMNLVSPTSSSPVEDKYSSIPEVCKCRNVGLLSRCRRCPVFELRLAEGKETFVRLLAGSTVVLVAKAFFVGRGKKVKLTAAANGDELLFFAKVFRSAEARYLHLVPRASLVRTESDGTFSLALHWDEKQRREVWLTASDVLGKCQFVSCCQGNLFARDNTPAVVHGVQCYQGESSVFRFKAGSELQCKVTLSPRSNRPRPFWKSDDVWLDLEGEARSLVVKERQVTLRENKLGPLCAYVTLINPSNAKKSVSIKAPTKIGKFYLVKSRKFDSDYLSKGSTPRKGDLREKIKKNISSSSRERKNFGKSERALTTGTPTQKKSGAVKIKEKSPPHSAYAHKSFLPRRDRKNTPIGGSALYSPREIRRERKRH